MVLVPVFIVSWLVLELYFWKRRSLLNAAVVALIAWFVCMTSVDWVATSPFFLWWTIATLAGLLVPLSLWPRTKSFD